MSNPYRDKLLSIGVISSRSRPSVSEGRHAATGYRYKVTTDAYGETTYDTEVGVRSVAPLDKPGDPSE